MARCERCGTREAVGSAGVWSTRGWLFVHTHATVRVAGCASCVQAAALRELGWNALLGWWCIPWGLLTPFVLAQNLSVILAGPSDPVDLPPEVPLPPRAPGSAERSRAHRALTLGATEDGRVRIEIAPDREPLAAWAVAGLCAVPLLPASVALVTALFERKDAAQMAATGVGVAVFGPLLLARTLGARVDRTVLVVDADAITVTEERRLGDVVTRVSRAPLQRVRGEGRAVHFVGTRLRLYMPGRTPRAVAALGEELDGLLRQAP